MKSESGQRIVALFYANLAHKRTVEALSAPAPRERDLERLPRPLGVVLAALRGIRPAQRWPV
jgi:hypothetical protein